MLRFQLLKKYFIVFTIFSQNLFGISRNSQSISRKSTMIFAKFREIKNNFVNILCFAKFKKCCFAATLHVGCFVVWFDCRKQICRKRSEYVFDYGYKLYRYSQVKHKNGFSFNKNRKLKFLVTKISLAGSSAYCSSANKMLLLIR